MAATVAAATAVVEARTSSVLSAPARRGSTGAGGGDGSLVVSEGHLEVPTPLPTLLPKHQSHAHGQHGGAASNAGPGFHAGGAADHHGRLKAEEAQKPSSSSSVPTQVGERSPEILMEMTNVLNLLGARPSGSTTGAAAALHGVGKTRTSSVASELLVSSALRMQWPVDRRKVGSTDAANACRDAAGLLNEAAQQLLSAASSLEAGGAAVAREFKGLGSDSKRRRTFGGPSPVRAQSPPGGGGGGGHGSSERGAVSRGSPPVRFAGLRV